MKNRKHTPEQIIRKLREADRLLAEGKDIAGVAKHREIAEGTYHRWRNQYGGMKANEAKRLKDLEKENARTEEDRRRPEPRHRHAERAEPGMLTDPPCPCQSRSEYWC